MLIDIDSIYCYLETVKNFRDRKANFQLGFLEKYHAATMQVIEFQFNSIEALVSDKKKEIKKQVEKVLEDQKNKVIEKCMISEKSLKMKKEIEEVSNEIQAFLMSIMKIGIILIL